jgi:hypothetical protein
MFAVALTALPALASGNARAASGEPWRLAQSAVNERQDRFRREQAPRDMDEQVRRARERERDDRRELERRALQRQLERRELERREQDRRDQDRRR